MTVTRRDVTLETPPTDLADHDPRDGRATRRGSTLRVYAIWLMIIFSLLAWRNNAYYTGGLDPTVLAKALLGFIAAALAFDAAARGRVRGTLGCRTMVLVTGYVAVTSLGALADGSVLSSAVLSIRVLLVAATVAAVFYAYPVELVLSSAMVSLAVAGLVTGLSGIGSLREGRLTGGFIPVDANQLAVLYGPPALWLLWRLVRREGSARLQFPALALLGALTWLTGSRTGFVALVVAALVVIVSLRRLPPGGFVALVSTVPFIFAVVTYTQTVNTYVNRNGTGKVATLSSRTIAWSSAFSAPSDFWHEWFGGGLAIKTVAVSGTYWNAQVLDSSWVSAFVQGGVLGMGLMGVFAVSTLVAAVRSPSNYRGLVLALVLYALIRSVLENGLIDSYVLFVVMLVPTFMTELSGGSSRRDPDSRRSR